jgi:hypothetical protein
VICTATEGCEENESCVEGACVADGCDADLDCTATSATPKCNLDTGACVECLGEGDCESNESCSGNVCVPDAVDPSAQIAAVRAAATTAGTTEATGLNLPVQGAFVSYVKAADAAFGNSDPAGFVLQAVQSGPAIFVAVDPATTTPALVVGDKVNLTVTAVKTASGALLYATAIDGLSRVSQGNSLTGFVQDVGGADLLTALADYDYELVRASATIAGDFSGGGTGHSKAQITTAGVTTANAKVVVRLPTTLKDSLGLVSGCSLTVNGFMWHYNDTAQLSAYSASEISGVTCPAVKVVSASATTATAVAVTFDRDILASSVNVDSFIIDPTLTISAVAVVGKVVTLTTSAQTAGTSYTVVADTTITDLAGRPVGVEDTATFTGFDAGAGSSAQVVISQVYGGGGNTGATYKTDFVELHNRTNAAVTLDGWSLQYTSATGSTWGNTNLALTGSIPAGGYFLIKLAGGATGVELPAFDLAGSINMSGSAGKVALVNSTTALTGNCPTTGIIDFVGFGTTADCSEGSAPAPKPADNASSIVRGGNGCTDTDNNANDFASAAAAPRTLATTALVCE